MKFNLNEFAGAFGDMGTFIPLVLGLTLQNHFDFATTLFFAGLFNLLTSFLFTVPMSVQPMKAIAAIALVQGFPIESVIEGTLLISIILFLLHVTNLFNKMSAIIPDILIRFIQVYLGIGLVIKSYDFIKLNFLLSFVAITLLFIHKLKIPVINKFPSILLLFMLGIFLIPSVPENHVAFSLFIPKFHPHLLHFKNLEISSFINSFFKLTLPQLPLTLLNSILAVILLIKDLYPQEYGNKSNVELTQIKNKIIVSVSLMNLVSALFGSIPFCHGAGGLASQYRFGARTNGSIFFLGILKMTLAVFLGNTLIPLLSAFPRPILGVLLLSGASTLLGLNVRYLGYLVPPHLQKRMRQTIKYKQLEKTKK